MTEAIVRLRGLVPASARTTWYAVATALVGALTAWGVVDGGQGQAITGMVVAAVTLLFAILHSTSPWRQALYGLCAAVGVVAVAYGVGSDAQVAALLAVVAPILGTASAAAATGGVEDLPEMAQG